MELRKFDSLKEKRKKFDSSSLEYLKEIVKPHIQSYDYLLDEGLRKIVSSVKPITVLNVTIILSEPTVRFPEPRDPDHILHPSYPNVCRNTRCGYRGQFTINALIKRTDRPRSAERSQWTINFGHLPIMLMSKRCFLRDKSPQYLVDKKEEETECGGYFICDGLERIGQLLIVPKRNFVIDVFSFFFKNYLLRDRTPISIEEKSFTSRREGISNKAVGIRCVRDDQSTASLMLYYVQNGSAHVGFWIKRKEFFLPVAIVLKALIDSSDHEIYQRITSCYDNSSPHCERALIVVQEASGLSRTQCRDSIGKRCLNALPEFQTETPSAVAEAVLNGYILVHLVDNTQKFSLLVFMLQKLFTLVDGTTKADNIHALHNQEVLLPGHLIAILLKEKLQDWSTRLTCKLRDKTKNNGIDLNDDKAIFRFLQRDSYSIGNSIEYMIKSGNLVYAQSLDLPQSGHTVLAERWNFVRFISQFNAVRSGAFFAKLQMKNQSLLPESLRFICPVQTPIGERCGLLNHMTYHCGVSSYYDMLGRMKNFSAIKTSILDMLVCMGMLQNITSAVTILLDGCIVGSIHANKAQDLVESLRKGKTSAFSMIPDDLEVIYIPGDLQRQYPGLYISTSPSRFIRPVKRIDGSSRKTEFIGPLEQAFLDIREADESYPTTHEEDDQAGVFGLVASMIPFANHNDFHCNSQQCEMAKKSIGFSQYASQFRTDEKVHLLLTPQSPIVKSRTYDQYCMNEFPSGTNVIVAIAHYSGYEVKNAIVLNKASVERGLFRTQTLQRTVVDMNRKKIIVGKTVLPKESLDSDGLPHIQQRIPQTNSPCNSLMVKDVTAVSTKSKVHMPKATVCSYQIRIPEVGDSFSNRHGLRGVCSFLLPEIDMPFSEKGIMPDMIISPGEFPLSKSIEKILKSSGDENSTVEKIRRYGYLLESVASKAGSVEGQSIDGTPFRSQASVVDEIRSMLVTKMGYNPHGYETLYNGAYGEPMNCEIFIGPAYYQRLHHMVADVAKVRSVGVVDRETRQPAGDAVMFGEMERDSLLAHGTAFLLKDRLLSCSDRHCAKVCSNCGSLLSVEDRPVADRMRVLWISQREKLSKPYCRVCESGQRIETIEMPYVLTYLAAELAAMNISMTFNLSSRNTED